MHVRSLAAAFLALALSLPAEAGAMAAGVLIGAEAKDLRGAAVGTVEDLIVDVRDGRVLYVIVDGPSAKARRAWTCGSPARSRTPTSRAFAAPRA